MSLRRHYIYNLILILVIALVLLPAFAASAESLSIQAQVDRQEVAVGESFLLQIKIDGNDSPAEPDLSGLQDFMVQPKGGGANNRESITIINGKLNRVSERGYIFRYSLTPRRDGLLTIPAIAVAAGGKTLLTQPINIKVSKPVETKEFRLLQSLSESTCYVGQPLVYTAVWYVNMNVEEFQFSLPVLEDQRFTVADHPEDVNYSGQDAITLNLHGSRSVARKGRVGQHIAVTLRKVIIPREAGSYTFEPATVASRVITGYQQQRGGQPGSPFSSPFFDDIFNRRQPVYRQLLTTSDPLQLEVMPLPAKNRPPEFSGLVGQYSLAAQAEPTEVNVGDPITLNIMVTGPEYLENVTLQPLAGQPSIRDNFKVPDEMGQGSIDGPVKLFTQTIRAKNSEVMEIPPISLVYFNPQTAAYETAKSNSISLEVKATKVVTALDAEGVTPGEVRSELATFEKGIAHNYVDDDILVDKHVDPELFFGTPLGVALFFLPPAIYLMVLVPVYIRRKRSAGKDVQRAKRALHDFTDELSRLEKGMANFDSQESAGRLMEAMRTYLAKRLNLPGGTLTFADVKGVLENHGVGKVLLQELQKIMDRCEALHYGGVEMTGSGQEGLREMIRNVLDLFGEIDACFRK